MGNGIGVISFICFLLIGIGLWVIALSGKPETGQTPHRMPYPKTYKTNKKEVNKFGHQ